MADTRFIVSKRRFPVTLDMRDGGRISGHVFLHYAKDDTGVPETPFDLVSRGNRFVVFDEELKGICFVGKDSILRMNYNGGDLPAVESVENFTASVSVSMSDGTEVEGDVCALLPEEHTRLFDLLNLDDESFLTISVAENEYTLLNLDYINKVTTQ